MAAQRLDGAESHPNQGTRSNSRVFLSSTADSHVITAAAGKCSNFPVLSSRRSSERGTGSKFFFTPPVSSNQANPSRHDVAQARHASR